MRAVLIYDPETWLLAVEYLQNVWRLSTVVSILLEKLWEKFVNDSEVRRKVLGFRVQSLDCSKD